MLIQRKFKTDQHLCLENFSKDESSEKHIGINTLKSTTNKLSHITPNGFPDKYLYKIKTPTEQYNEVARFLETIFTTKKIYLEEELHKSYSIINLSFKITYS